MREELQLSFSISWQNQYGFVVCDAPDSLLTPLTRRAQPLQPGSLFTFSMQRASVAFCNPLPGRAHVARVMRVQQPRRLTYRKLQ